MDQMTRSSCVIKRMGIREPRYQTVVLHDVSQHLWVDERTSQVRPRCGQPAYSQCEFVDGECARPTCL